ncbi:MAG TPA: helicase-related protein [Candidatus Nanoarchaeia archaeon]|nr:helicase-related protein [Candidatus Nanoarchaeia archaeon]
MLKTKPRLYQESIFANAVNENTLIVLPTGLGKTLIALMLAIHHSNKGSVLMMAPTKPLCEQHKKSFIRDSEIKEEDCALITGAVKPKERETLYQKKYVFATPQTIRNDLLTRLLKTNEISLMIFDEAHRAVGDYAYTFIASIYEGRITALSASPGSDEASIKEICNKLKISHIESRTDKDSDVKQYINEKKIHNITLELPDEIKEIMAGLKKSLSRSLKELKDEGLLENYDVNKVYKRDLLNIQRNSLSDMNYKALSLTAKAIKIIHALELLQTQGVDSLKNYFKGLKTQQSKAARELIREADFQEAMSKAFKSNAQHPKFKALLDLVNNDKTHLVFTQYRETAEYLTKIINENNGKARLFVGQRGNSGMSQKEQLKVLQSFRNGEYKTLVSTSISEEGLDIPSIDTAIFFEPVPSALRTVQRMGRVGRAKEGEIYVLITNGTIDEKYKWVAHYKEKKMRDTIKNLDQNSLKQSNLNSFIK